MRWERLQIQGGPEAGTAVGGPRKRWGHTCNATRGGKLFYVFGGYGKDNCQTNQVHVFDTTTRTWSEPVIKGTPPTPRDSHTCTTVGDNLFVFGGTDGMNPLKDLHILDTTSNTWISPTVRGEGPEAREGHSAALIGKRLFIFGGCGKSSNSSDEIYYNDLYILNTETFVWKHAETSGMPPAKRDSHTCSSWKNKVIVVGGEDACNYYLSDVHILDADTLLWGRLNTSGHHLPPRAGHTTVALGKYLFLFGGFTDEHNLYDDIYMLDVDTGIWTKVAAAGTGPSARFSMAGDTLDPQLGGVLVFIGGCNKNLEALDDMYYLYTGLQREKDRDERRIEKLSLRKQLKLKCQEKHIVAPVNDRALIRVDTNDSLNQSIPAPSYVQPSRPNIYVNEYQMPLGKRAFQAKVTKSFPYGYNIETIIDGKLLRGVLFSSKSSFKKAAEDDCNGKGETGELGHAKLNVDDSSKPEKSPKHGRIDDRLPDGVNREQSVQYEPLKETADPKMNNPATSDTSQAHEVLGDSKTFVSPNVVSEDNGTSGGASTSNELPKDNEPAAANIVLPLA